MKIYEKAFLVGKILETEEEQLNEILSQKADMYEIFQLPKKNGMRCIYGLQKEGAGSKMRTLQKRLYRNFLVKIPVAIPAKGFVKGENYLSFLQPHVGKKYFMRVDIRNFFDSLEETLVTNSLREYIADEEALRTVVDICTVDGKIPQGAITSPALSNIVFKRADQRILKYCQAVEERCIEKKRTSGSWVNGMLCYTRYADDLLFSSDFLDFKENRYFLRMISNILSDFGFFINRQKTVMCKDRLAMNGYVVDTQVHLSRSKLGDLKKILYFFRQKDSEKYALDMELFQSIPRMLREINQLDLKERGEKKKFENLQQFTYYLSGCRSWVISVVQADTQDGCKVQNMQKFIKRTELLLDKLQEWER